MRSKTVCIVLVMTIVPNAKKDFTSIMEAAHNAFLLDAQTVVMMEQLAFHALMDTTSIMIYASYAIRRSIIA